MINYSHILLSSVKSELNDFSDKITFDDNLIYHKLTHYQNYLIVKHKLLIEDYELELYPGMFQYPIDDFILSVNFVSFFNYKTPKKIPHKLSFSPFADKYLEICNLYTVIPGDIAVLKCFLKPDDTITIDGSNQPVIPIVFHPLLVKCVLSEYRKYNPEFLILDKVESQVRSLDLSLHPFDSTRINFKKSIF